MEGQRKLKNDKRKVCGMRVFLYYRPFFCFVGELGGKKYSERMLRIVAQI
jgi:hypothetical protein